MTLPPQVSSSCNFPKTVRAGISESSDRQTSSFAISFHARQTRMHLAQEPLSLKDNIERRTSGIDRHRVMAGIDAVENCGSIPPVDDGMLFMLVIGCDIQYDVTNVNDRTGGFLWGYRNLNQDGTTAQMSKVTCKTQRVDQARLSRFAFCVSHLEPEHRSPLHLPSISTMFETSCNCSDLYNEIFHASVRRKTTGTRLHSFVLSSMVLNNNYYSGFLLANLSKARDLISTLLKKSSNEYTCRNLGR